MSKKEIKKGKSGVAFFEYTSWAHRYKILESNGKVKYLELKSFKTEEEAIESYYKHKEEFEEAQRNYYVSVNKEIMFKDYLIYWFENIYSERIESTTKIVSAYIIYKLIIPNIEYDVKIGRVTTEYLDEIVEKASKMTESGGYSSKGIIIRAMKDAVIGGYITYNPSLNMKVYRRPKPKITVLNERQIKKFLNAAKQTNWYLEILLALFSGLRKAEILGLKFDDFNEKENTIKIERQIVRESDDTIIKDQKITYKLIEKKPKTDKSIRCLKVADIIIEELNNRKQKINVNRYTI